MSGYTFRGSIESDPKGDIFVIQAKNVSSSVDIVSSNGLTRISSKPIRNPYFLQRNDILLVSRGTGYGSFRASVFAVDDNNIIASSSVHVIRVTNVMVLPKYLCLFLNSVEGQKKISEKITGGSSIQSILLKNLSDLEIMIPSAHIQKTIIALHENLVEQEKIRIRKKEIQQIIFNSSFNN
jgi:restriction endonuclease S subunit